jgi:hypothetical protein
MRLGERGQMGNGPRHHVAVTVEITFAFSRGAKPGTKEFNNEHVIPEWVLRDRDLHLRTITLPNSAAVMYGRFVVPCCKDCNEKMGVTFETPISAAFAEGYEVSRT